ncbi:ph domain containing protein [Stylonychia lemnae]|uniref:Ph domain containing protein n=1 Tax=Stylonychia lemnae TaxID=5949 RepID=A0A078AZ51_STYLE|nr:ph domain containing protein [Stylonychia lemnae]|eukprot:CDW86093.1 ph domain containing protein [Stylonychia lemnae]
MEDILFDLKQKFAQKGNKLTLDQLKQILSENASFEQNLLGQNVNKYFDVLDKDKDGYLNFSDLVSPVLPILDQSFVFSLLQTSNGGKVCQLGDLLDASALLQDPSIAILLGQMLQTFQNKDSIDETEFSNAIMRLEKRLLQFVTGSAYLVGNRNLHEFTLSLKDYSKIGEVGGQDEVQDNAHEEEQLDDITNLNTITDLIKKAKVNQSQQQVAKSLSRKEVSALETLQMNYSIIQSENSVLRAQNQDLLEYKVKFEKLQDDIQNGLISSAIDGKQILQEFKEQNENQLKLIETLKNELERIKKENDIYKRFNKSQRKDNKSDVLQKLIEKSEQECVDLKNVQLKKIAKMEEDLNKQITQDEDDFGISSRSEVVLEKSTDVSTLKNVFEGPAAQEQALQKRISQVEVELIKSKNLVDKRLSETDIKLGDLKKIQESSELQDIPEDEETKEEVVLSLNDKLRELGKLGLNPIQYQLERMLLDQQSQRFDNVQPYLIKLNQEQLVSQFSEEENMLISHNMKTAAQEELHESVYIVRGNNSTFKINSKQKKQDITVIVTKSHLYVLRSDFEIEDLLPLTNVESVILSTDQHQVLAVHSIDRPDVLLEVGNKRTELVSVLLQVFETSSLPRFKIYASKTILIKEEFDVHEAKPVKLNKNDDEESKDEAEEQDAEISNEMPAENFFQQMYRNSYHEVDKYHKQYDDLRNLLLKLDKTFTQKMVDDIYLRCVRVGMIMKKTQKMFKGWTQKFCVITNAGMVYFNTQKKGDLDPRKFYPLNDFQIKEVDEKTAKRKFAFKIIFERKEICKELLLAALTQAEKDQWIIALKEHQRQLYDARIQVFQHKLQELKAQQH